MSGFDANRLVGVENWLSDELKCSICLNVFNKAVVTQCGHNFCLQCIQTSVLSNGSVCPQCRRSVVTRKRTRIGNNVNTSIEHIFNTNYPINAIIGRFQIKCDFEANGCPQVIELSLLDSHLKTCDYNFAQIRTERKELIECKQKLNESEDECNKLKTKNSELEAKTSISEVRIRQLETNNTELSFKIMGLETNNKELLGRLTTLTRGLNGNDGSNSAVETNTTTVAQDVTTTPVQHRITPEMLLQVMFSTNSTVIRTPQSVPKTITAEEQSLVHDLNGEYIRLRVVGQDGNEMHFRHKITTAFRKLKKSYSERVGRQVGSLRFLFDGCRVNDTDTPQHLKMNDNDVIEVYVEACA